MGISLQLVSIPVETEVSERYVERSAAGFVPVGGSVTANALVEYLLNKDLMWEVLFEGAHAGFFGLARESVDSVLPTVSAGVELWASTIYVFQGFRNQGLGSSIKRASVDAFSKMEYKELVSIVRDWNTASLGLNGTLFPEITPRTFVRPEEDRVKEGERVGFVFSFRDVGVVELGEVERRLSAEVSLRVTGKGTRHF